MRWRAGPDGVVLGALRDAQYAHQGESVSAGQIAAVYNGLWRDRSDLVTQALWLLHAQGLAMPTSGATRGWKIIAAGRTTLAPRRGPARERPVIGGRPSPAARVTKRC